MIVDNFSFQKRVKHPDFVKQTKALSIELANAFFFQAVFSCSNTGFICVENISAAPWKGMGMSLQESRRDDNFLW